MGGGNKLGGAGEHCRRSQEADSGSGAIHLPWVSGVSEPLPVGTIRTEQGGSFISQSQKSR